MRRQELPPPICYMKTLVTAQIEDGLKYVLAELTECICVLEKQESLTLESYVLSRMLYKMGSQWRREKSMQGLKRVNACIMRFRNAEVLDYVTELNDHFKECNLYLGEIYLPSQQMIVHLLKQYVFLACLMSKIFKYCQYTYVYISQNLALGNFIPQNMIYLSLLGRIWTLSKSLCFNTCKWYENIYRYIEIFPKTEIEMDTLPENLKSLLSLEEGPVNFLEETSEDNKDNDLHNSDKGDWCMVSKPQMYRKSCENTGNRNNTLCADCIEDDITEDLGEKISRKSFVGNKCKTSYGCSKADEAEDFGVQVTRNAFFPGECDTIGIKNKIDKCKSFKKLKIILLEIEVAFGKSAQTLECRKKLKLLKREHLLNKQSGRKDELLLTGKSELGKILVTELPSNGSSNLSGNSNILENGHQNSKEKGGSNGQPSAQLTFDIKEILKKPYKGLKTLINRKGQLAEPNMKRVKKCACDLKRLRKKYSHESNIGQKQIFLKTAEEKVSKLLISVSSK